MMSKDTLLCYFEGINDWQGVIGLVIRCGASTEEWIYVIDPK